MRHRVNNSATNVRFIDKNDEVVTKTLAVKNTFFFCLGDYCTINRNSMIDINCCCYLHLPRS